LSREGVIFIDNLLWHGYTASVNIPEKYKKSTEQIREFNKIFSECSMLNSKIYPIGDGVGIGIKI
jgi:predicted O-methyltransferase YrrM